MLQQCSAFLETKNCKAYFLKVILESNQVSIMPTTRKTITIKTTTKVAPKASAGTSTKAPAPKEAKASPAVEDAPIAKAPAKKQTATETRKKAGNQQV